MSRIPHALHDIKHTHHIGGQVKIAATRASDKTFIHHFLDRATRPVRDFVNAVVSHNIFLLIVVGDAVHRIIYILPEPIHRQAEWLPQVLRVGVWACYTTHTSLGMADNDAISQGVKVKLGTKMCKKLHRSRVCAPNMGFGRRGVEIAPLGPITRVSDRCRLGHFHTDVRSVGTPATVPCLYSPR